MALYMAGKTIPSETPTVTKKEMSDQETTSMGMDNAGLKKHMAQPAGSFSVSHSGGAPKVIDGPNYHPQNALLGPTNMHVGSGMKSKLGKLYVAPDSVT